MQFLHVFYCILRCMHLVYNYVMFLIIIMLLQCYIYVSVMIVINFICTFLLCGYNHNLYLLDYKMAEKAPAGLELKTLQAQLTCPVCLDQYNSPKTLPCLHSFCLKCIQQVAGVAGDRQTITCPVCTMTAALPRNGVSDFPTSFFINNLIEICGRLGNAASGAVFSPGF